MIPIVFSPDKIRSFPVRRCLIVAYLVFTFMVASTASGQTIKASGPRGKGFVTTAVDEIKVFNNVFSIRLSHKMEENYGYFYATKMESGRPKCYYYIVMIYDAFDFDDDEIEYVISANDNCAEISHRIEKKKEMASYKIHLSDCLVKSGKKMAGVDLQINGKSVDLSKGKVFLIDFTNGQHAAKQSTFSLPNDDDYKGTDEEAAEIFKEILENLEDGRLEFKSIEN